MDDKEKRIKDLEYAISVADGIIASLSNSIYEIERAANDCDIRRVIERIDFSQRIVDHWRALNNTLDTQD